MKRIVEFSDGTFGIEKRNVFQIIFGLNGEFKDLVSNGYWWSLSDEFINDCKSDDLDKVKAIYNYLQHPIKRRID